MQMGEAVLEAEAGQGSCTRQPWALSAQDSEQVVSSAVDLIPGKWLGCKWETILKKLRN